MKLHLIIILCVTLFAVGCTMFKVNKPNTKQQYKLIVELLKNATPQQIQENYPDLKLTNFKPINRTKNIWSLDAAFNTKAELEQALKILNADKLVSTARLSDNKINPPSNSTNTKKGKATISG